MTDSQIVPPGWALIPLGETGQWAGGGTPSKSVSTYWEDGSIPWVSPKDMKVAVVLDTIDHITESAVEESSARLIPPNSILFVTRSGILEHTFPVAQSAVPVTVNQDIKALTPAEPLNPGYIAWGARAFEYEILQRCSKDGTTVASVDTSLLQAFPLPVAPVPEQHRIVEAIESYLARLDDAMATLERVQRNLKRYRASVLKAAVEGRLVPTEAELARAEGREYEPASVLLERILVERRRHWEDAELAKMKAKGKVPKNDKWKAKYVEPVASDTSELPELPEGWCWAFVSQLLLRLQTGPFGSSLHKTDYMTGGTPVINPQHLQGFGICPSEKVAVGPDTVARLSSFRLQDGDIVLGRRGEMGRCALVGARESGWLLGTGSLALKPAESINSAFFLWVLRSPLSVATLEGKSVGTTMTNLNQEILYGLPIPLPPCHEQKRIVQETERHFSLIENLEREVATQLAKSSCLSQSILKWAFEGRLVDQDPNDEPAEVLLERIRAERAASHGKKKTRPRQVNTRSASA